MTGEPRFVEASVAGNPAPAFLRVGGFVVRSLREARL